MLGNFDAKVREVRDDPISIVPIWFGFFFGLNYGRKVFGLEDNIEEEL